MQITISVNELESIVKEAVEIALNKFGVVVNDSITVKIEPDTLEPLIKDVPLDDLDISVRTYNILRVIKDIKQKNKYSFSHLGNIYFLQDANRFSDISKNQLKSLRNFGEKTFTEFKEAYLEKYGIELSEE
jgi:DNA-directed RNA polymerase alpha subunit